MENQPPKKKLLLVDANPGIHDLLEKSLPNGEYEVQRAVDWLEALAKVRTLPPRAVITEWFEVLNDPTGPLSLLHKLKVPSFLFTAQDPEKLCPDWQKAGFQGAWPKSRKHRLVQGLMDLEYASLPQDPARAPTAREGGACNVLIIDDSPTVRGFIRRSLEAAFPQLILREAEDGRTALSEMTRKKVDLIFTDLDMPGMDGKTFLRLIRNNPILRTKPIVVLSGSVNQEFMDDLKNENLVKVLKKPSSPGEIQGTAREMLGLLAV